MPVKRTTEVERLKAENEALQKNLQAAVVARDDLVGLLKTANEDIALRDMELAQARGKVSALEAQAAGHDARVQALDAGAGPRPDEPRAVYPAKPPFKYQDAPNRAAADAMKAARPNYWFDHPVDAQAAWAAAEKARRKEESKKRFVPLKTETEAASDVATVVGADVH